MPLSNVDRMLLDYCLAKRPFAWESFVDRFLVLIVFVVQHTAQSRQMKLVEHDEFDLVSDVFLTLLHDDFAILRRFRGQSSLATYLTVVARRVVVRKLIRLHRAPSRIGAVPAPWAEPPELDVPISSPADLAVLQDVLEPNEASLVRMFHLERKSVEQISEVTGIAANSVGTILEEARRKMTRQRDVNQGA